MNSNGESSSSILLSSFPSSSDATESQLVTSLSPTSSAQEGQQQIQGRQQNSSDHSAIVKFDYSQRMQKKSLSQDAQEFYNIHNTAVNGTKMKKYAHSN